MKKIISIFLLAALFIMSGCSGSVSDSSGDVSSDTTAFDTTASDTTQTVTDVPDEKFEMREDQVYAADILDTTEVISIAFMGGSLTNGGIAYNKYIPNWPSSDNAWVNETISYFVTGGQGGKQVRQVKAWNAALPGTQSSYAAARFMKQVAANEPDIIFLEYSANDSGWDPKIASVYYEQIIRMCLSLDKIPVIIFVHAPMPITETSSTYEKYIQGIAAKDALAEHYGIKTINAYEYLKELYAADNKGLSFLDWLGAKGTGFYNEVYEGNYDVHPNRSGYSVYSGAVKAALDSDFDGYMSRPKFVDIYNKGYENIILSSYNLIPQNDERIEYEGEWTEYTLENMFITDDRNIGIGDHQYKYPYFVEGIRQTIDPVSSSFTFKTKASYIAIAYMSATYGSNVTFYLVNEDGSNGEMLGTIQTEQNVEAMGMGMDFSSGEVRLPAGGGEYTVRGVVEEKNDLHKIFRFGYIIECFEK